MKKKWIIVALMLMLETSLIGCTNTDVDGGTQKETESGTATESGNATESEEVTESVDRVVVNLSQKEAEKLSVENMLHEEMSIEATEWMIECDENASVGTYCMVGDNIYYELNYADYYEAFMQEGPNPDITYNPIHNTKIMAYNTTTQETSVLYEYEVDRCVRTLYMECNGQYLVWEDSGIEVDGWRIKCIDLACLEEVETIATGTEIFDTGELTITNDYLYWCNQDVTDTGDIMGIILFKYDFVNKQIVQEKNYIDSSAGISSVSVVDGVFTKYRYVGEDNSEILITKDGEDIKKIYVDGKVKDAMSNGEFCAWKKSNDSRYLYVYDVLHDTYMTIDCNYIVSFALYNNVLLVNQQNGIYVYDIFQSSYYAIRESESNYCLYTYLGIDGVYAKLSPEEFQIIYIH